MELWTLNFLGKIRGNLEGFKVIYTFVSDVVDTFESCLVLKNVSSKFLYAYIITIITICLYVVRENPYG